MNAQAVSGDIKLIADKAIVKGTVLLNTLYQSPIPEEGIQFMEHELPFTEVLDLPGAAEGMSPEIEYTVDSVYFEADDEEASDMLGVEIKLGVHIRALSTDSVEALSDCYSTEREIVMSSRECGIDHIADMSSDRITVRGTVSPEQEAPGISQIYSVVVKPFVNEVITDEAGAEIKGVLDAYVLYLTDDSDTPLYSFKGEIPFSHRPDVRVSDSAAIECAATSVSCSYTLAGELTVDVRANLEISVKVIDSDTTDIIYDVEAGEEFKGERPSVVIYFIAPGDTLWNIAKKYKTTVAAIAEMNGINENDILIPGNKLIIP